MALIVWPRGLIVSFRVGMFFETAVVLLLLTNPLKGQSRVEERKGYNNWSVVDGDKITPMVRL